MKSALQILSKATGKEADYLQFANEVECIRPSEALEAMSEFASQGREWIAASELNLDDKNLPEVIVTFVNNKVFAYDSWNNMKGLREIIKHHPEMLCLCFNKPVPPPPKNS